jgi:hypothetical protein
MLTMFQPRALNILLQLSPPQGVGPDQAAQDLWFAAKDVQHSPGPSFLTRFVVRSSEDQNSSTHNQQQKAGGQMAFRAPTAAAGQGSGQALHFAGPRPVQDRARLLAWAASSTAMYSSNSSRLPEVHPGLDLSPDAALDVLLYQAGSSRTRRRWRNRLDAAEDKPIDDKVSLEYLCAVYHLPAACDPILTVLVCSGSNSPDAASARVQRVRALARQYVEGCRSVQGSSLGSGAGVDCSARDLLCMLGARFVPGEPAYVVGLAKLHLCQHAYCWLQVR